jgi:hypothetical protein
LRSDKLTAWRPKINRAQSVKTRFFCPINPQSVDLDRRLFPFWPFKGASFVLIDRNKVARSHAYL